MATDCGDGKQAANWVTQNVQRELNERQLTIDQFPLKSSILSLLLRRIVEGEMTVQSGREVFEALMQDADAGVPPSAERIAAIIDERGLARPTDTSQLESIVDAVIAEQPDVAADVRAGKQQAVGPLIGQVVRRLKGADPQQVRQLLLDRLKS